MKTQEELYLEAKEIYARAKKMADELRPPIPKPVLIIAGCLLIFCWIILIYAFWMLLK